MPILLPVSRSDKLYPMFFYMRRNRISVDLARSRGIVFECTLENRGRRLAIVLSEEYELWLTAQQPSGPSELLSRLSFDLTSLQTTHTAAMRHQEIRPLKLVWPASPYQLQRIEDFRQGTEPNFEIRNRLMVLSQHYKPNDSLHEPQYAEESACDSETNGYPVRFKIDHMAWSEILEAIGFKHIILHEFSIPALPPAFGRAEDHLTEAWRHHRAGREDSAMMSCYKAFECLGFSITGVAIPRAAAVAHLMSGQEEIKREAIETLWDTVTKFYHLGRHDRGSPVQLTHADGELAVVSATALLRYLARPTS